MIWLVSIALGAPRVLTISASDGVVVLQVDDAQATFSAQVEAHPQTLYPSFAAAAAAAKSPVLIGPDWERFVHWHAQIDEVEQYAWNPAHQAGLLERLSEDPVFFATALSLGGTDLDALHLDPRVMEEVSSSAARFRQQPAGQPIGAWQHSPLTQRAFQRDAWLAQRAPRVAPAAGVDIFLHDPPTDTSGRVTADASLSKRWCVPESAEAPLRPPDRFAQIRPQFTVEPALSRYQSASLREHLLADLGGPPPRSPLPDWQQNPLATADVREVIPLHWEGKRPYAEVIFGVIPVPISINYNHPPTIKPQTPVALAPQRVTLLTLARTQVLVDKALTPEELIAKTAALPGIEAMTNALRPPQPRRCSCQATSSLPNLAFFLPLLWVSVKRSA